MAEYFQLSPADRLSALDAAASTSGRLPHLLEKDIWVVWLLQHLFGGPYADHLVFKGGTSLSKAYLPSVFGRPETDSRTRHS